MMHGRIGHNRTADLAESIRSRVGEYNDAVIIAEQKTHEAQLIALSSIFELDHWFVEHPDERQVFYDKYQINLDPRVKHQAQPLVKHFLAIEKLTGSIRNKITFWAGAITEARRQNVAPEGFIKFIRNTPDGILGAYRAANRSLVSKEARGETVNRFTNALVDYYQHYEATPITVTRHTADLGAGKHLAVIEVDEYGNTFLTAVLERDQASVEQSYQSHVVDWYDNGRRTKSNTKPKSLRRYNSAKKRENPIILDTNDPAALSGRTRHQHLLREPSSDDWVLKSGEHSRKLGSIITKGKWSSYPIYGLTLEERATCPRTCQQWLSCYGNGIAQHRAYRYRHGPSLTAALDRELTILSSEPKTRNGYAIRLHTLGDFYDCDYVHFWEKKLKEHPALHVFGFTAWHPTHSEIGQRLKETTDIHWERFAIRFSNQPAMDRSASVIPSQQLGPKKGDGIICPAELGQTDSCSTCGFCWQSERPVVFIEH